jgi:hypothetical protein
VEKAQDISHLVSLVVILLVKWCNFVFLTTTEGLTVGRVALLWPNKKIGPRRVIYIYSVFLIA